MAQELSLDGQHATGIILNEIIDRVSRARGFMEAYDDITLLRRHGLDVKWGIDLAHFRGDL